jgi:hypothetical protein
MGFDIFRVLFYRRLARFYGLEVLVFAEITLGGRGPSWQQNIFYQIKGKKADSDGKKNDNRDGKGHVLPVPFLN